MLLEKYRSGAYFTSLKFRERGRPDGAVARVLPAVLIPDVRNIVPSESASPMLNQTRQPVTRLLWSKRGLREHVTKHRCNVA